VNVTKNGTVTITLSKSGFAFVPDSMQTTVFAKHVAILGAAADGVAGTTATSKITITLDQIVPGLSAADINLLSDTVVKNGALTNVGAEYTLPVTTNQTGMVNLEISKAGYEFTPDKVSVDVYYVSTGYTYPVARELYIGVSRNDYSTTNLTVTAQPLAAATGRIYWYVNSWNGNGNRIDPNDPNAPTRTALNAAQFLVVEYATAPPAGRTLILSLDAQGSWAHSFAQANALAAVNKVVVTTDGVSKQYVFDLRAPYSKAATTALGPPETVTATGTTYGMTINPSTTWTDNAATRAWLANSRTGSP
jgi:hypothetical protein